MKTYTFNRGIHPTQHKETAHDETHVIMPKPGDTLIFPMRQHIGVPCTPTVEKGERVLVGQKIGDSDAFMSVPIHASVSGEVTDIKETLMPNGIKSTAVFIKNDGVMDEHSSINIPFDYRRATREELLAKIREAGIVGLGGAGFPTHVKLNPPADKKIDTIIVNIAECEPYLTTDHRVLLEETEKILNGLMVILSLFPDAEGVIGIEDNKMDGILKTEELCAKEPYAGKIRVARLKAAYPQGAEKQMIFSVTGREVPSGGLPSDVGCIVHNVDTVIAIHRAVYRGRPIMRKIMTVAGGAVVRPGNYKVRLGMRYEDMMQVIGGFHSEPYKLVAGGPMMGNAMFTLDLPMTKVSQGFLAFTEEETRVPEESNCIRCSRCVQGCPARLLPFDLNKYVLYENRELFKKTGGMDCIECGCCSYQCPAKRRLAQSIRAMRRDIMAKR